MSEELFSYTIVEEEGMFEVGKCAFDREYLQDTIDIELNTPTSIAGAIRKAAERIEQDIIEEVRQGISVQVDTTHILEIITEMIKERKT